MFVGARPSVVYTSVAPVSSVVVYVAVKSLYRSEKWPMPWLTMKRHAEHAGQIKLNVCVLVTVFSYVSVLVVVSDSSLKG